MSAKLSTALVAVARRQSFVLRWVFALTVSLTLPKKCAFELAGGDGVLDHATRDFDTQIDQLDKALQAAGAPQEQLRVLTEAVGDIATQEEGVRYVGVFDADGIEVRATDPGRESVTASDLQYVIGVQHTRAREDQDATEQAQERRFVFLRPARSPEGLLIVKIEQSSHVIELVMAQQRRQQLLGLLGSIVFAVPMSYLLGGRTLRRRHQERTSLPGLRSVKSVAVAITRLAGTSVSTSTTT
jgi:hypothetical protein